VKLLLVAIVAKFGWEVNLVSLIVGPLSTSVKIKAAVIAC
jgi:hypothetical protein